jgi:hypothetical protein
MFVWVTSQLSRDQNEDRGAERTRVCLQSPASSGSSWATTGATPLPDDLESRFRIVVLHLRQHYDLWSGVPLQYIQGVQTLAQLPDDWIS